MPGALLSVVLTDLGRDAVRVAAALILAVALAIAFAVASVGAILGAPAMAFSAGASSRVVAGAPAANASATVVRVARSQIGRPYLWGGTSPAAGFDCSGLVQWAYRQVGLSLPRTAQQQFDATTRLAPDRLLPGDLLFFAQTYSSAEWITHVGIYVGGEMMVNAPRQGDVIREMPAFTGFWGAHFAGAGRIGR